MKIVGSLEGVSQVLESQGGSYLKAFWPLIFGFALGTGFILNDIGNDQSEIADLGDNQGLDYDPLLSEV